MRSISFTFYLKRDYEIHVEITADCTNMLPTSLFKP